SVNATLAIETRELCKSFGRHRVLDGANLSIPAGSASVVLGPSGTGKSVLIKHVIGLLRADSGQVLVNGVSLSQMSRSHVLRLRRDIGVMFQDGALFSSMSVYDNVAFPLRQHTDLREREVRQIVMEHLHAVGLEGAEKRAPAELSGGMRKRAGLARSLVLDPEILLCDEPDSGLDPVRTTLLGELLRERHRDLGGTMLVVTHNVALARVLCDHVSLLWKGRILESGPAAEVFASEDPFVQQFLAGDVAGPLGMD
ncbi:MAG: transporter related protein, partial [Solirubrobacterales bacterium]|nr:transporter related protein [Solirubrobacterales bacterium]